MAVKDIPVLIVSYLDESKEDSRVRLTPKTYISFERQYNVSAENLGERTEYVYFMAYVGLQHKGELGSVQFDDWIDTVEGVTVDDATDSEEVETAPFPQAPSSEVSAA